jgi:hypothetical protein
MIINCNNLNYNKKSSIDTIFNFDDVTNMMPSMKNIYTLTQEKTGIYHFLKLDYLVYSE